MAERPALNTLYRATHYEVRWGETPFVLRVDQPSHELAACHRAHGVRCSAFISAWNPHSQPTDAVINAAAQARLVDQLQCESYPWLPAWGRDPTGAWPAEQSLLVLGMQGEVALRAARGFQQRAVLLAGEDAVPRLAWVD